MTAIAVFASHATCEPGLQGLAYIDEAFRQEGIRTVCISGGDPCAPTDSHLFVVGPEVGPFRYSHPYVHTVELDRRPTTENEGRLLAWLQESMNWVTRAGVICVINPVRLSASRCFEGIHVANFHARLKGLCEASIVSPAAGRDALYGKPLWQAHD